MAALKVPVEGVAMMWNLCSKLADREVSRKVRVFSIYTAT
jgi:hypothetical protein